MQWHSTVHETYLKFTKKTKSSAGIIKPHRFQRRWAKWETAIDYFITSLLRTHPFCSPITSKTKHLWWLHNTHFHSL